MKKLIAILCSALMMFNLAACTIEPSDGASSEWNDDDVILTEDESEDKIISLYIDLSSEKNLLLNTYSIDVSLDGELIGSVENGGVYSKLVDLLVGEHTLLFTKEEDSSVKATAKLNLKEDSTYRCTLCHDSSKITMQSISKSKGVQDAFIKVPDVTGRVLGMALTIVETSGFVNVHGTADSYIFEEDNWIVTEQSIAAGQVTDKNAYIELKCVSLNSYFHDTYVGKNLGEVMKLASSKDFTLKAENEQSKNLTESIKSLTDEGKLDWLVVDAEQDGKNTALVTLRYIGEQEEITKEPEPTKVSEPTKVPRVTEVPEGAIVKAPDAPSYSSNSKATVKNGNAGLYSYIKTGTAYDNYCVIDFDEGYVYMFTDGRDGGDSTDRIKIDYGDLNQYVKITFHDDGTVWSYGLHFKWKRQPDTLIIQDNDGFDLVYTTTNLDKALEIRNKKRIVNY